MKKPKQMVANTVRVLSVKELAATTGGVANNPIYKVQDNPAYEVAGGNPLYV
jgi:hypothetical protein